MNNPQLSESLHTLAENVTLPESDLVGQVGERVRRRRQRMRVLLSATAAIVVILLGFGITAISLNRANGGSEHSATGQQVMCPRTFAAWKYAPQRAGTKDTFVPNGSISAIVCRYDGPSSVPPVRAGTPDLMLLTNSGSLTGAEVQQVAASLNSLPYGAMHCPLNPVSVLILRFMYPSGPDVDVTMGISDCWNGSNGDWHAVTRSVTVPGFVAGAILPTSSPERTHRSRCRFRHD